LLLLKSGRSYFFADCALFVDGKYIGSGCGAGETDGRVLECYGSGNTVLRLGEDGYVSYESGVLEIGLLRDCGGADEVRQFGDGVLYVYRKKSACGWGVYEGSVPAVYDDLDQPAATAIAASTLLSVVGAIHGTA
jgi:hypothetical protein